MAVGNSAGVRAGKAFVSIEAIDRTQIVLDKVAQRLTKFQNKLREIGRLAIQIAAPAAIVGGLATREFATFEQALANMRAAAGLSADEFVRVRSSIMDLSKELGLDPSGIANVFTELLKAGMSVRQVLDGAGKAAVQFARVGGLELEEAAVVMRNAMHVFGAAPKRTVDSLSAAADASSISIQDIAMSFQMAAAVGGMASQTIEDMAAAIGILGNNGLRSRDAGTSLKVALTRLIAPADSGARAIKELGLNIRDAQGQVLPLRSIIERLQASLKNLSPAERDLKLREIFGTDAIRAALILLKEGVSGWDDFRGAMGDSLSVSKKFSIMMDTMRGRFERLMSAAKRLGIEIGSALSPLIDAMVHMIGLVIDSLTKWVSANQGTVAAIAVVIGYVALFGASMMGLAIAIKGVSLALTSVTLAMSLLKTTTALAVTSIVAIMGPLKALSALLSAKLVVLGLYRAATLGAAAALLTLRTATVAARVASVAMAASIKAASLAVFVFKGLVGLATTAITTFGLANTIITYMLVPIYTLAAAFVVLVKSMVLVAALAMAFYPVLTILASLTAISAGVFVLGAALSALWPLVKSLVAIGMNLLSSTFTAIKDAATGLADSLFGTVIPAVQRLVTVFADAWAGISAALTKGDMKTALKIAVLALQVAMIDAKDILADVVAVGKKLWIDLGTALKVAMIDAIAAVEKRMLQMMSGMITASERLLGKTITEKIFGKNYGFARAALDMASKSNLGGKEKSAATDAANEKKRQSDFERDVAKAKNEEERRAAQKRLDDFLRLQKLIAALEFAFGKGWSSEGGRRAPGSEPEELNRRMAPSPLKALEGLEKGTLAAAKQFIESKNDPLKGLKAAVDKGNGIAATGNGLLQDIRDKLDMEEVG